MTCHRESINEVEPLEELLEGLAVEAFEEQLGCLLVELGSVEHAQRSWSSNPNTKISLWLTPSFVSASLLASGGLEGLLITGKGTGVGN